MRVCVCFCVVVGLDATAIRYYLATVHAVVRGWTTPAAEEGAAASKPPRADL